MRAKIWIVFAVAAFISRGGVRPVHTYTTADGLAADHISAVLADSRGFVWIGTPEGLSRFDGYRFVTYGVDDGLPHNYITTIVQTQSGDVLVGTARGVSRISPEGSRFMNAAPANEPSQNFITAIHQLRSGKILCTTPSAIYEWSAAGFIRQPISIEKEWQIGDIAEDAEGHWWLATTRGIAIIENGKISKRFTTKDGLPGKWIEALLFDSKGRMWAAARGGVAMLAPGAAGDWRVGQVYTQRSGMVGDDVKALAETSDRSLWIATSLGMSRFTGSGEARPHFENLTRAEGLSDRQINALAEDQAGNIWAGTEGAGLMQINRTGFTTYGEADGLSADRVMSVFEDRSGELIAITVLPDKRAINLFDGAQFRSVYPKTYAEHGSWGWNQIVLQSRSGEWWASTAQGLCRYGVARAIDLDGRTPKTCYAPESTIFRIFEDSKGGIWASAQSHPESSGDRLMRWDPRTNRVVEFPAPRISGGAADDLVSAFAEDRSGNIWMGLYKGGLYRYDGRAFRYFPLGEVPAGTVFALLVNESGLWIGTNGGGIAHLRNPGDASPGIEVYNTARGIASNTVRCLVDDREGHIYAGTSTGIDRLDPANGHIRHFSTVNGLAHGDLNSAWRDGNGALWFATTQGLSKLVVDGESSSMKPRVLITDVRIGGATHPISQLGQFRVARLRLKPSQNQLQVEFVGVDPEPGEVVRYRYKLEGADREWSPPGAQRSVDYAALADGSYRFLVKAVTSDGVESDLPAEVGFTILPPLWKRWWFETLAIALAAAAVWAAHRYRLAQAVNLERIRTAIATDLHDDIGASLSQIAILSEVARVRGADSSAEPLERVATLARELVDSIGDIVWSIRSDSASMDSLIRRMREFALDLLQGADFELRAPHRESASLALHARRELFLMFKECIHNAARHSRCTRVWASLTMERRDIALTVQDNGIGMNLHEVGAGTGIENLRRRASSLGGTTVVKSKPGEGCTVIIRLPARGGRFARR